MNKNEILNILIDKLPISIIIKDIIRKYNREGIENWLKENKQLIITYLNSI